MLRAGIRNACVLNVCGCRDGILILKGRVGVEYEWIMICVCLVSFMPVP